MIEWTYLANYGFSAIMCGWFMFRTEKVINTNTDAMNRINATVEKCRGR
jgi:hypothetical protein